MQTPAQASDESNANHHAKKRRRLQEIMIEGTGKSFWIWDEDNAWRERVYDKLGTKIFEYSVFALIVLNCMQMAFENRFVEEGSDYDKVRCGAVRSLARAAPQWHTALQPLIGARRLALIYLPAYPHPHVCSQSHLAQKRPALHCAARGRGRGRGEPLTALPRGRLAL